MSYRKLKADYLFDGYRMLENHKVLICRTDGTVESILDEKESGDGVESLSGLLTPGFINCHCHLELSHLKDRIPEKQGLVNFVLSVMAQRNFPDELKQESMFAAESQMLESGIAGVGDICNTGDTGKLKSAGRLFYYNFIELLGWMPDQASSRYKNGKKLAALLCGMTSDQKRCSLNPHAPYSVSAELWDLMTPDFAGKTITIHNQESAAENEFFKSATGDLIRMYSAMNMNTGHFKAPGLHSLPYFLPKLKTASKILLVHNTYTEESDLADVLSFNKNLFFCLCPNANLYIEDKLPDVPLFINRNTRMVMGTDSLASNRQLSILEEIKTIKKYFPEIPTAQLLLWATSNGAAVLSMGEQLGDFSKGKKPGVVLIEHMNGTEIQNKSSCRRIL
jgi:aminodeoxyfutalosine deaminase